MGEVRPMADSPGCLWNDLLVTFLGLPLGSNPNTTAFWQPEIDRHRRKLASWKKEWATSVSTDLRGWIRSRQRCSAESGIIG